jgi:hypothetical protein
MNFEKRETDDQRFECGSYLFGQVSALKGKIETTRERVPF